MCKEIFEQSQESYFDKYLNEVLYLFENSGADVVVFEDMDRYNTNQIFQRLREVNTLINNRKKKDENPIRFFYLLRDDIFVSKERTKFFDFIMPVVPVLDGSNSFDQFIMHFKQGNIFQLFDEHFLQEISLYIDDMRILKNIYNEFLVYYKRISTTEQDPNKLLAIIIYKNIFPRDFSDLQLNKGFVHTLFSKKDEFVMEEEKRLREEIAYLNQKIEAAEKEHLQSNEEVDAIYKSQIDNLNRYYNRGSEIQKLVQESQNRKENLKNRTAEQKENLKNQINQLDTTIAKIKNKKLHEIINKQNTAAIFKVSYKNEIGVVFDFNEIKGSDYFPLIKYLIKNGYIDETYPDYMTYFYEHSLSRIDKIFLRSVTDEEAKEYTYRLKNPEMVNSRLRIADFDKSEVLNFDLLSYLLEHKIDFNNEKSLRILKQLCENRNFKFISLYLETGKSVAPFVQMLNSTWPQNFTAIVTESGFTREQKKAYALESIYDTPHSELENINEGNFLSEFISDSKDFLNIQNPDIQCIVDAFRVLGVKFKEIDYEQSNKELFQAIYENNFYVLSFAMICLMLRTMYGHSEINDFKHKNSTIVFSSPDEPLANYVKDNISEYVQGVLRHCEGNISDDEEIVVKLLNDEALEMPIKDEYLDNLQTPITHIQDIKDPVLWRKLLDYGLVLYLESNVLQYFFHSGNAIDKSLADFINDKGKSFKFNYDEIDNNFGNNAGSKFFNAIVKNKELHITAYAEILKSLHRYYKSFNIEGIPDVNMDVLIEQKIVTMTPEVLLFMREHYPQKVVNFIRRNIQLYTTEVITQDNFEFDELLEILESNVEDQYKLALLKYANQPISVINNSYSIDLKVNILENNFMQSDMPHLLKGYPGLAEKIQRIVIQIVEKYLDVIIEKEFFLPYPLCKKIFETVHMQPEVKLELFALTVDGFNVVECKECLEALGYKEYLSVFSGKRPTLPATETHKKILEIFLKKHWIAGFDIDKKDENLYRVSSKRVQKQQKLPTELL